MLKECEKCNLYNANENNIKDCNKCIKYEEKFQTDCNINAKLFNNLNILTREKIKIFLKNYIGLASDKDEYGDEIYGYFWGFNDFLEIYINKNNFISSFINSHIKNKSKFALEWLKVNLDEIFNFNNIYKEFDGGDFMNFSNSDIFIKPDYFLDYYINNNYNFRYYDTIKSFTNQYLNINNKLDENWYKMVCTIVDNI